MRYPYGELPHPTSQLTGARQRVRVALLVRNPWPVAQQSGAEHSGLLGNLQLLPQTAHLVIESNYILRRDPVQYDVIGDGDVTSPVGVEGKRTSMKCDGVFAHNASLQRGRNIVALAEFCEFIGQTRFHRDTLSAPLLAP